MGKAGSNHTILQFMVTLNSGILLPFHMVVIKGMEIRVIKDVTSFIMHVKERGVSILMEADNIKVVNGASRFNSTNVFISGKDVSTVSGSIITDSLSIESKTKEKVIGL